MSERAKQFVKGEHKRLMSENKARSEARHRNLKGKSLMMAKVDAPGAKGVRIIR